MERSRKRKSKKRITPPAKKNGEMEEESTFSREYNEQDLTGNDELNTISPEKNMKAVQTDFAPEKAIDRAQLESKILRHSILVNNCPSGQVTENINCISFKVIFQNREKFKYFVGLFPKQCDALFDFLNPTKEHLTYWDSRSVTENVMRTRTSIEKCSIQEQLFITLLRLRRGFILSTLAHFYDDCEGTIFVAYLQYGSSTYSTIFKDLRSLMFPERKVYKQKMPAVFKKIKNIRCIIDCTEGNT